MSIKKLFTSISLCIVLFIAFFGSIILIENLLFAHPATREKIQEVLHQESDSKRTENNINAYIEVLDFLEKHKQEIIDSLNTKDTAECVSSPLYYFDEKSAHIPKHLFDVCKPLVEKLPSGLPYLEICNRQFLRLHAKKTDRKNYLYIWYSLSLHDVRKKRQYSSYKETFIQNKYHLGIEIEDAFNFIDPNNFAPN
jgi:hypothetical protein